MSMTFYVEVLVVSCPLSEETTPVEVGAEVQGAVFVNINKCLDGSKLMMSILLN